MNIWHYLRNALGDLGLTEGEADVFLLLHQSDAPMTAEHIRHASALSTSGAYKVIRSLLDKEFVLPMKERGAAEYAAISLDQVAKKLGAKSRQFVRISEKLTELNSLSSLSPDADIFEGNALTDYYLNLPSKINDFIWCVGSFAAVMNFFGPAVERDFIQSRIKKGKHADAVIFDDSLFSKELAGRDIGEKRETRLIPHSHYPMEFSYLFGNTCLDFYKDADNRVQVLKTESPELARARLIQYQTLWNSTAR
ncbi:MAG: helix-turn-helix domain-containing protein [Candidatus Peribacteraceae bacterium]|nr:helix-turn-helix domain-containing protein [Candidatus Peribacteraceae bacterium]MDD5742911.1 helix-turn-helix domain-containing protein [Candidatus Peribacteraceae bacterium]